MSSDQGKLRPKEARAEVSRRLKGYYSSLVLGLEDGAAELLERVERRAIRGDRQEAQEPTHPVIR